MYADHVPMINAAMRASLSAFKRGVLFAILSARQPITSVPDQLRDVSKLGAQSRYLFAWKRNAFDYLETNSRQLWQDVCACADSAAAISILCRIPGMGIVKAAFVLQFLGHDIACLDTHNLKAEGLGPEAFKTRGPKDKSGPAFARRIARYVKHTQGRSREFWDNWCVDIGETYGRDANEISALHCAIVGAAFRRTYEARENIPF